MIIINDNSSLEVRIVIYNNHSITLPAMKVIIQTKTYFSRMYRKIINY